MDTQNDGLGKETPLNNCNNGRICTSTTFVGELNKISNLCLLHAPRQVLPSAEIYVKHESNVVHLYCIYVLNLAKSNVSQIGNVPQVRGKTYQKNSLNTSKCVNMIP